MAKQRTQFLCNHCGSVHPKWMGKCPDCGTWDSLEEYKTPAFDERAAKRSGALTAGRAASNEVLHGAEPLAIAEIEESQLPRLGSGIGEFDRVLGGGLVPGSAVLVGGEPGIGKSTLLLQVANALAEASAAAGTSAPNGAPGPVLYVTSEESARQTALRAGRLGAKSKTLLVLAETNVERIQNQIHKHNPAVVIIDSIQMIYKPELPAAPGSVTQLRDCCMELVYLAKASGVAIIFVGHVTKAGTLAGPKIIEHIVDTVIYFEGDRFHSHRIVRCIKNRFGNTHEVGLFEMTGGWPSRGDRSREPVYRTLWPGWSAQRIGDHGGDAGLAGLAGGGAGADGFQCAGGGQAQGERRKLRSGCDDHRRPRKARGIAPGGR